MCTIGVRRFEGDEYVLFKSKDFARDAFDDRLVLDRAVFGVQGLSTWDGTDPESDVFSGISLGANEHGLFCTDANVAGASGLSNYDELVEIALRSGGSVDAGIAAIRGDVSREPYLWANIIMIDTTAAAVVEVRGNEVAVEPVTGPTALSNHHLTLAEPGQRWGSPTTVSRLANAQRRLEAARTLDDVFALQQAHDDGATGICSHEGHQTVYSYALHRQGGKTTAYVTRGHPCAGGEPVEIVVPLGERWSKVAASESRSAFPSAEAMLET